MALVVLTAAERACARDDCHIRTAAGDDASEVGLGADRVGVRYHIVLDAAVAADPLGGGADCQVADAKLEEADLFVKDIWVDGGRQLKRLRPAPQGRGHRIRKRSNHVTLVVDAFIAGDVTADVVVTNEKAN